MQLQPNESNEVVSLKEQLADLRRQNERLAVLAYRDGLTGLRNRQYLNERLGEELSRISRGSTRHLSVMVIDVNGLKAINDNQGHLAGDQALVAVAQFLEAQLRLSDVCCRLGGDEFLILLPDTDAFACAMVERRLRRHLGELMQSGLESQAVAIGTASCLDDGDNATTLVARADRAMYADKQCFYQARQQFEVMSAA